ncbi:MAG: sulfite exporter TauE/SafE family protein, partial [Selenomonas sp.]|nr:sulfite exporter TauE/SafE family protein [Selenomonas sp.]
MEILLFFLLGLGVGTFGTLVGIGGGLICVPIFILFLSQGTAHPFFQTAAKITGTSLVIVMANALSGTLAYIRQKRVYFQAAIPFALATLPGAFFGSYIVDKF